jgi:hypothetical protein
LRFGEGNAGLRSTRSCSLLRYVPDMSYVEVEARNAALGGTLFQTCGFGMPCLQLATFSELGRYVGANFGWEMRSTLRSTSLDSGLNHSGSRGQSEASDSRSFFPKTARTSSSTDAFEQKIRLSLTIEHKMEMKFPVRKMAFRGRALNKRLALTT